VSDVTPPEGERGDDFDAAADEVTRRLCEPESEPESGEPKKRDGTGAPDGAPGPSPKPTDEEHDDGPLRPEPKGPGVDDPSPKLSSETGVLTPSTEQELPYHETWQKSTELDDLVPPKIRAEVSSDGLQRNIGLSL
jgi:hypothetical protein